MSDTAKHSDGQEDPPSPRRFRGHVKVSKTKPPVTAHPADPPPVVPTTAPPVPPPPTA